MKLAILEAPDATGKTQNMGLRILSNLRFHESPEWRAATCSIYPDHGAADTAPWPAWREALALWRRAPDFDAVVTMGARESLLYGLLCRLTGRPSHQILSEIFLDEPRPAQPLWRLKESLLRAVAARCLGLLANSRQEQVEQARRLGIPATRALFVPLNANAVPASPPPVEEGFLVAAGRSWRDYPTLLQALAGLDIPAHLFIGRDDLPGIASAGAIRIHREAARSDYLEHLRRCSLAVVPLLPVERATGQVVLLEAMVLGKAVIASRAPGTVDYLEEGRTGLFVPPSDARQLRAAITRLWNDTALRAEMGEAARRAATTRFSIQTHAAAKLAAIHALASGRIPPVGRD